MILVQIFATLALISFLWGYASENKELKVLLEETTNENKELRHKLSTVKQVLK